MRTFRGTPASVPEARRFVGELLAGCPARETLMTCVSELCANAIRHTASGRGGAFTVEVARPRAGVARIAVTDDGGPSVPRPGTPDPMAESGRGLAMVAACTSRWGYAEARPGRWGYAEARPGRWGYAEARPGLTVWAEASWPVPVPARHHPSPPRNPSTPSPAA